RKIVPGEPGKTEQPPCRFSPRGPGVRRLSWTQRHHRALPRGTPRMSTPDHLGGIIHTYQKYDPVEFPSPTAPPPDLVSPAFEHLLTYGSMRRLTEEELARAVRIDPSQIKGLGPSLEALMQMLQERKRKILETYETDTVQAEAHRAFHEPAGAVRPPG